MTAIAPRRPRTESGIRSHVEQRVPVRASLVYAVLGTPAPLERQAPRVFHGPKKCGGSPRPKLTDEQVLRIRALQQFRGMRAKQIAEVTGHEIADVELVLTWRNRVHLDPKPEHAKG